MTSPPVSVHADTSYKELVELMVREGISGLPVVGDGDRVVGIVTEADLISKEAYSGVRRRPLTVLADILSGRDQRWVAKAAGWKAGDLMTHSVVTCRKDDDIRVAARRMLSEGVKRLPVLDGGGVLVGIVSRQDLLRVLDRPDDEIAADIRGVLRRDPNLPEDFHVDCEVEGGVAVLTGDVRYEWDRPVVVSRVRAVPGVIDVVERIHARQPNPHTPYPPILLG